MTTSTVFPASAWPSPSSTSFSTASTTMITTSTLPATTTVDALLKLCLLWSVLNKPELSRKGEDSDFPDLQPTPVVCNEYFLQNSGNSLTEFIVSTTDSSSVRTKTFEDDEIRRKVTKKYNKLDYKYVSSRSLAVIGALGGIIFILLVVALTTCVRHRRELYQDEATSRERGYARDMLLSHIRQFRASVRERRMNTIDPPPSYEDVVKVTHYQGSTELLVGSSSDSLNQSSSSVQEGLERSVIVNQIDDDNREPPSYQEAIDKMKSVTLHPVIETAVPVHAVVAEITQHENVTTIHIEQ